MKKKTMTGLIIGLSVATVLAAGGAVGIAAIATNGFKNNEVITPALSMEMVDYGETYTRARVEAALVNGGYTLEDYKLRSFLDENYWSLNSFKKDKANHLKASELKIFTDEDNGKVLTVGGQTIQSYGTFGSKVDIAFKEAEGIYFASEADYEFSSVGTSTLLFDPSGFDLVVAIDSSYGFTVIDHFHG